MQLLTNAVYAVVVNLTSWFKYAYYKQILKTNQKI